MQTRQLISDFNIDPRIVDIWIAHEGETLLPIQRQAVHEGGLLTGESLLVVSPTSSGKTFVGEMAAIKTAYENRRAIILLPMKALIEEKYRSFRHKYSRLGLQIVASSREHREFDEDILAGRFDIALVVYEKFERLLVRYPDLIRLCGLIVVDEIQMIGDVQRGANLELTLGLIRQARLQNHPVQFVGLSAVLSSLNGLDRWLPARLIVQSQRPVDLWEGVYQISGSVRYRDLNSGTESTDHTFPPAELPDDIPTSEKDLFRTAVLTQIIPPLVAQGQQILVYRKWRRLSRQCAEELANYLPHKPVSRLIKQLGFQEDSLSKTILLDCLRRGIAFHNADLSLAEREMLEQEFCRPSTALRVLVATSTLGLGVNLPVDTIVIADLETIDPESRRFQEIPLDVAAYKNLAGRAGRLKLHNRGQSILISLSDFEAEKYWQNYVCGEIPAILGTLHQRPLLDSLVQVLGASGEMSAERLHEFMFTTFTGISFWQQDEEHRRMFDEEFRDALLRGTRSKLIEAAPNSHQLRLTKMGRDCVRDGISPTTYLRFRNWFQHSLAKPIDIWEILFIAAHALEMAQISIRLSTLAFQEGRYPDDLISRFGYDPTTVQRKLTLSFQQTGDRYETIKRLKMSLVALDWINGRNYAEIEKYYNKDYDDKVRGAIIREIGEMMSWLLNSIVSIAERQGFDDSYIDALNILGERLLFGVPVEGLNLAHLRIPALHRRHIVRLIQAGYDTPDQLLDLQPVDVDEIIPQSVLIEVQERLLQERALTVDSLIQQQELRLHKTGLDTANWHKIYHTTGKKLEDAIEKLMTQTPLSLAFQRIVDQKFAEPDFLLHVPHASIPFEIASSTQKDKKISLKKATEILHGAARYKPKSLVVIGKPDFHDLAIRTAQEISEAYRINFSLIPIHVFGEIYVRVGEKRLSPAQVEVFFQQASGYVDLSVLNRFFAPE